MTTSPVGRLRRFEQRARFVQWPRDVDGAVDAAECTTGRKALLAFSLHWLGELLAFPGLGGLAARHGSVGLLGIASGEVVFAVRYLTIGMRIRTNVRWIGEAATLRLESEGRLLSRIRIDDRTVWLATGDARLVMQQISKGPS